MEEIQESWAQIPQEEAYTHSELDGEMKDVPETVIQHSEHEDDDEEEEFESDKDEQDQEFFIRRNKQECDNDEQDKDAASADQAKVDSDFQVHEDSDVLDKDGSSDVSDKGDNKEKKDEDMQKPSLGNTSSPTPHLRQAKVSNSHTHDLFTIYWFFYRLCV